jgi:hypothetical protein
VRRDQRREHVFPGLALALCLVAYLIVERERLDRQLTWRQCKRQLILQGVQHSLPALERVRKAA